MDTVLVSYQPNPTNAPADCLPRYQMNLSLIDAKNIEGEDGEKQHQDDAVNLKNYFDLQFKSYF